MTPRPTRETPEGRAYLELRKLARRDGRPTDEYLQLYALEAFLNRLRQSPLSDQLILKGGVLMAAFGARRPTRDIDFATKNLPNDLPSMRAAIGEVISIPIEDGLEFRRDEIAGREIREGEQYPGIRVQLPCTLSGAKVDFHVDINIGDPIVPAPRKTPIPRILGGEPIVISAYGVPMVLAEKVVTAIQRGTANTRWRDFADIVLLTRDHSMTEGEFLASLGAVADHRGAALETLSEVLHGIETIAARKWAAWIRKQRLESRLPTSISEMLRELTAFTDPILGDPGKQRSWDPEASEWR